jgi:diguanylate cyclase (GGDEF)-like protein
VIAVLMWALFVAISLSAFAAGGAAWATTRRQQRTVRFLYAAGRAMLVARDLEGATIDVLRAACERFRADTGSLKLFPTGPDGTAFRSTLRNGETGEVMRAIDPEDDDEGPEGVLSRTVLHLQASSPDARIARVASRLGVAEGMAAALRHDDRAVGYLVIGNRSGKPGYKRRDLDLFQSYADLTAMTLERSRLHDSLVRISALQSELADRAFHDPLTELANRVLFVDRIEQALLHRDSQRDLVAILYVDLDGFRRVNAEHGHAAGDAVLIEVAARLRSCLRRSDTAARLGGDEFALLLVELLEPREAELIAQRVVDSLGEPMLVDGNRITLSASVGLASAKPDAISAALLLRNAATAMDAARQSGAGGYAVQGEPSPPDADNDIAAELAAAIARDELVLHYQPIVELATGKILGAEALVRWAHPTRGLIAPMHFLPAAAECGLAERLEGLILRKACQQVRRWQDAHPSTPPLAISVNVTAHGLAASGFAESVSEILRETGVDPVCLILEVTENAILDDLHSCIVEFDALQRAGVHIAIDDVGTGYTSLAYLRRLPIDILKIARPLVAELGDPNSSGELARTVVRHGEALRHALVAEGVEGALQVRRLVDLGCTMAQGFHLARPCDAAGMEALLAAGNLDPAEFSNPPGTRSAEPRRPAERTRRVRSPGAAARNPA